VNVSLDTLSHNSFVAWFSEKLRLAATSHNSSVASVFTLCVDLWLVFQVFAMLSMRTMSTVMLSLTNWRAL
jgi:hypothetical protein